MKRTFLIYGLILGVIVTVNMLIMANMCNTNPYFETNDLLGYAAMIVVYSLIFFGVRNYKKKLANQQMSFGQGFRMGAFIALVAATMYMLVWVVVYYNYMPGYIDQYTIHRIHNATVSGKSAAEIEAIKTQMASFKELYKNPAFVVVTTMAEVLIAGLIVATVSALILRTRNRKGESGSTVEASA